MATGKTGGRTRRGSRGGSKKTPKVAQQRVINEEEGVVVKVLEFGGDTPARGSSKQLLPDLFESVIQEGEVIRPLYDPLLWAMLLEQNVRLNRCIGAMALNTVGLGFELAALRDSKEFVEDNAENIKEERARLMPLFKYPNADYSFEEMMQWIKTDEEAEGQSYMEVSRDGKAEIDGLYHAPGHTIRVLARGEGFLQMRTGVGSESFLFSPGKTSKDSVEKVYFKNFGDDRKMDKATGEFKENIPREEQANELIMFKIYSPRSSYYGVPRFVAAAPAISGNRLAQLRNVAFFENDACFVYSEKVATPKGWSTMGDMKVGSEVIGSDGKALRVLGVYPQKEKRDVYNVKFCSGTEIRCTDDHVWAVASNHDRKKGVTRNLTLAKMMEKGARYNNGMPRWSVPLVDPVEYDQSPELPLDPYFLGILLGDGCFTRRRVQLTCNLKDRVELMNSVKMALPKGTGFSEFSRDGYFRLTFNGDEHGKPSSLWSIIDGLGLADKTGGDKFIPEIYLRASIKDREALLQGLIDSDGSIQGTCLQYCSISESLAHGVKDLAGSLGAIVSEGLAKGGAINLVIRRLPESVVPSQLTRKLKEYKVCSFGRWHSIDAIEYAGKEDVLCIKVDADDGLYVTTDFVLTHNTPRMAIIVSGGTLDSGSVKMIQNFIEAKGKGVQNYGRVMVLQPEQREAVPGAEVGQAKIDLMPLTVGVTEDASFTRYLMLNDEIVREAFGIGKIFLGTADDVNRATAFTMKQITMEQVFEPEIKRYEHRLNITLMRDLGAKYTKLRFTRPRMTDVTQEALAYATLAAAGGVSPNDIRDLLGFDPFQGDWAGTPISVLKMGYTEGNVAMPTNPEEVAGAGRPPEGAKETVEAEIKRVEHLYGQSSGYRGGLNLIAEGEPVEVLKQLRDLAGDVGT